MEKALRQQLMKVLKREMMVFRVVDFWGSTTDTYGRVADLIGCWRGVFVAIEVKWWSGRGEIVSERIESLLTPLQWRSALNCVQNGGLYYVVVGQPLKVEVMKTEVLVHWFQARIDQRDSSQLQLLFHRVTAPPFWNLERLVL